MRVPRCGIEISSGKLPRCNEKIGSGVDAVMSSLSQNKLL
jgi:hypothetical protein